MWLIRIGFAGPLPWRSHSVNSVANNWEIHHAETALCFHVPLQLEGPHGRRLRRHRHRPRAGQDGGQARRTDLGQSARQDPGAGAGGRPLDL